MYRVYITKVKNIRPAENADRLNLADVFGTTTVVDKTVNINDLYIYFPVEGQISQEFGEANDLFRRKDENGKQCGGFIDPNKRNITAIRLRGNKSDGLILPLTALEKFGDISILKEGDTVETFNGHTIAVKYIPIKKNKNNVSQGNKTRKKVVPIAPLFKEHADTEQFEYNINDFNYGDLIEITLKLHGCFVSGTKVRMGDGTLKEIQTIKVGDKVLGYDFKTKSFKSTKVKNIFHNAPSNKWNKIKFSRNHIAGDKRGYITSTYNHPYWFEEKQCWIEAKDLVPGMKISTLFPSYILTQQQKDIAIGLFLGDGCLQQYDDKVAEIQTSSKKEHEEYIDYLSEITDNYCYKTKQEYVSGYGTQMVRARTMRTADLYNYFKDVTTFNNQTGKKLLPGIVDKFTILSLAIFYMDDGNLSHNDKQKDRANFAICDYTNVEDQNIICDCFRKFDIEPSFYLDNKNYPRIRLNAKEAYKMFDLIYKYIPPIMRYKLPEEYRNKEYIPPIDVQKITKGYVFSEQEVLENIELNETHKEFDLETELHNYVVGLSLVHNTSGRTAYLPVLKGYKKTFWDKLLRRDGTPIYDWDIVSGTRRVVLDTFDGGFYGSNAFRKKYNDFFKGKLLKGETCYFEIVGFTDDGSPIMGEGNTSKLGKEFEKKYGKTMVFSYGCEPNGAINEGSLIEESRPKNDIYVYRMTMTNEDGDVVEYTPDYMRYRCEQMGVKTVPVLEQFYLRYGDPAEPKNKVMQAKLKSIVESWYEGPDLIDPRHIREGVVIRIVNRPKFTAYKAKGFDFKVLTNIIKENFENDDLLVDEDILQEL